MTTAKKVDRAPEASTIYPINKLICIVEGDTPPPVLLLHGWGGNQQTMQLIAERLIPHRQIIRPALPGFGDSPEPAVPWGTWDYVEIVRRLIDESALRKPLDVIAHSFGGRVAIGLAARHPELVGRLVLIGSAGLRPRRSFKVKLKRFYSRQLRGLGRILGGTIADKLEQKRQRLGSEDWRQASPLMRGTLGKVLDEDLSCELKSIGQPTLLLWGELDTATPLWMGRAMQLLIPGAELVTLKNAGHYSFIDKPGESVAAIWKHLQLPGAW